MNNKPFNIFDKPAPATKSIMLGDLELTTEEFNTLKNQISHGLVQIQSEAEVPDELANAVGKLGSATNPVGCSSIPACLAYLKRLRTTDGCRIQFQRKGCTIDIAVSQHPIDVYVLTAIDGKASQTIYMSGYRSSDSRIAPEGFKLTR
jgi:hypothetical protein